MSFRCNCWDFVCPQRTRNLSVHEAFTDLKNKIRVPFAMDLIILASWIISIVRNNKIFENKPPSFTSSKAIYLQELQMLKYKMKKKYINQFETWLQSQI